MECSLLSGGGTGWHRKSAGQGPGHRGGAEQREAMRRPKREGKMELAEGCKAAGERVTEGERSGRKGVLGSVREGVRRRERRAREQPSNWERSHTLTLSDPTHCPPPSHLVRSLSSQ